MPSVPPKIIYSDFVSYSRKVCNIISGLFLLILGGSLLCYRNEIYAHPSYFVPEMEPIVEKDTKLVSCNNGCYTTLLIIHTDVYGG